MREDTADLPHAGWSTTLQPAVTLASARRDVLLFAGAIAIVGVHAAVDSFLAPEPGTGADDHLLRGLATFVRSNARGRRIFAATGRRARRADRGRRSYSPLKARGSRSRMPARSAPAARTGAVSSSSRSDSRYSRRGPPLAWRSRKPGRFRYLRRAGIAAAAVLAAYWLVVPVAIGILATHRPRSDVALAELGRPYEEVTIRTSDGLDLAAWYVPSRNGAAVISYPTRQGSCRRPGCSPVMATACCSSTPAATTAATATRTLRLGRRQGHRRRHRLAEATARRHGRPHRRDRLLGRRRDDDSGRGLQHRASRRRLRGRGGAFGPRASPSRPSRLVGAPRIRSADSGSRGHERHGPPPSLTDLVPRISPRPLFLVYAGRGGGGEELNPDYYRAALAPKGLWMIPEARHVGGFQARPRAYEGRVTGFFDRALLGPRRPD